jgi:hypothetical protein
VATTSGVQRQSAVPVKKCPVLYLPQVAASVSSVLVPIYPGPSGTQIQAGCPLVNINFAIRELI